MPTVRVYSKSGDDRSIDVKALLRENGVAYTDYDVEKNPSMKKEALSLTKDKDEFPVVLVDGKVVVETNGPNLVLSLNPDNVLV